MATTAKAAAAARAEEVARLRAAIGRLSRVLRQTAAAGGLTPTQISVLFTIVKRGPLALSDLAEREALNPTMLSRVVGALAQAGLVTRTTAAGDRRAALVAATAAGRRLRERIHSERNDVLAASLARLEEGERAAILAALPALEALVERVPR
jgi:DNA-binding MarR family transcriptional regulator